MTQLYPFFFQPLFKEVVWGGQRLRTLLDKPIDPQRAIGESWELVDLPQDQSVVTNGPLAGRTLGDLREQYGAALMGSARLLDGRFPVLVKYIDAHQTLSVQVHPDEVVAKELGGRPKSECWYILSATPGAKLYVGLKEHVTRAQLLEALATNTVETLLHHRPVHAGDFVPIPSGTVHAIGEGIVLLEIQQASDTTYRLYDWGRVGLDGKPRALHLDQSLRCIERYEHVSATQMSAVSDNRRDAAWSNSTFVVEIVDLKSSVQHALSPLISSIVIPLDAAIEVACDAQKVRCSRYAVCLIPAECAQHATVNLESGTETSRVMLVTLR